MREILQLEVREHKMAQRRCVDVLGSLNECLCLSYTVYCRDTMVEKQIGEEKVYLADTSG